MTGNPILPACDAGVNTSSCVKPAAPISAVWSVDRCQSDACVCVLESTQPFSALLVTTDASPVIDAEFDGIVYSIVLRGLTDIHAVYAYNEQVTFASSGMALLANGTASVESDRAVRSEQAVRRAAMDEAIRQEVCDA